VFLDGFEEGAYRPGVGAHFFNGTNVKVEVADESRIARSVRQALVGFLAQHDFVDETLRQGEFSAACRQPGHGGRRDAVLQVFEQGHEVPHRKNMVLHEAPQVIDRAHGGIEGMSVETGLQFDGFRVGGDFHEAHSEGVRRCQSVAS
jgi:hypothetical protein